MRLDVMENTVRALEILGKGMLGIFVVMVLIMLIVFAMSKAGKR